MPGAVLTIDGQDFSQHLRLAPGEGLDPFDPDVVQPGFGDFAGNEGAPLISTSIDNREMVFPVHFNAAKRNLVRNGHAEIGIDYWQSISFATTFARQTGWSSSGEGAFRCTTTAMAAAGQQSAMAQGTSPAGSPSFSYPTIAGRRYKVSAQFNILSRTGNGGVYMQINWYDAGAVFLSGTITNIIQALGVSTSAGTLTAPANAAFMHILIIANEGTPNPPTSTIDFYVDDISVTQIDVTKQDLHDWLRDTHLLLSTAKKLTWHDEGATNLTNYDIVSARFEPDYNYRRAQKLWTSGVIRAWVRPYGHTGTFRSLASAVGTGVGVAANVSNGSVTGDVPANQRTALTTASFAYDEGRIVGLSVVPSGYAWDIPLASFSFAGLGYSGSKADLAGVGCYSMMASPVASWAQAAPEFAALSLTPASVYAGRNRIFALVKGPHTLAAYKDGVRFGAGTASTNTSAGHNVIDLGVFEVNPQANQPDVDLSFRVEFGQNNPWDSIAYPPASYPPFMLNRMVIVPDEFTALVVDTDRRLLGYDPIHTSTGATQGVQQTNDTLGNVYVYSGFAGGQLTPRNATYVTEPNVDRWTQSSVSAFVDRSVMVLHEPQVDLDQKMMYVLNTNPLSALRLGKSLSTSIAFESGYTEIVAQTTASAYMNIMAGAFLAGSIALAFTPTIGVIHNKFQGARLDTILTNMQGSVVATLGASHGLFYRAGWTSIGMGGSGYATAAANSAVLGWVTDYVPSRGRAARDRVFFDSASQTAWVQTSASVYVRDLQSKLRGVIPDINPTMPQAVVGFALPIAYGDTDLGIMDVNITVRDRFRYAR